MQGISRQQFEALQPQYGPLHEARPDGSVFAVAITALADSRGPHMRQQQASALRRITLCRAKGL